jgi:hypothetical protein
MFVAVAAAGAAAQNAPAEPKNYSIDPWHLNVPKPIANPVTSVTAIHACAFAGDPS